MAIHPIRARRKHEISRTMARVDKKWLIDNLQWAAIILLGVGLAVGYLHHKRSVRAERRRVAEERSRADEAHRRLNEADQRLDQAAAERAELAAEQAQQATWRAEQVAFMNAVITELRLKEGQQQRKPDLRIVKDMFAPVALLLSGMWAAARAHWPTVATGTAAVALVAAGGYTYAVYEVPATGQHLPPAAAAPRTPTTARQHALPAPSEPVTPPITTEVPTSTPTTTPTTTTTAPAVTTAPRATTATNPPTKPPTATDTPIAATPPATAPATPAATAPEVAVAPATTPDEAPKVPGGNGKSHKPPKDAAIPAGAAVAAAVPVLSVGIALEGRSKVGPDQNILCVDVHPLLDACVR